MSLYRFSGRTPVIGAGSYVSELAMIIGDVRISENCYIGHGAILRGDYGTIEIGPGTAIEEGTIIHAPPGGACRIGRSVTVGHAAIVHAEDIGDYALIGMGAILSLRAKVGGWAIVAEGSVVKNQQRIPEKVVVAGNPARIARSINPKDIEFLTGAKQLYVDLAHQYSRDGIEKIDSIAE
ncbi:MAG: gamma carbonic anhydrase family protein [Desulfotomaculaceae bacterium]|nr:gamma carbonic anhydrase family protein [Desulfotomaculaceae bacterium]